MDQTHDSLLSMRWRLVVAIFWWLTMTAAAAQAQSIDILPLTPTQIAVPNDAIATVRYQVTNTSATTRSLVMQPITGIAPDPSETSACAIVFMLSPSQSCVLDLRIDGASIGTGHVGGPTICRALPSGMPDPLQCFRPSVAAELQITVTPGLLDDGFELP